MILFSDRVDPPRRSSDQPLRSTPEGWIVLERNVMAIFKEHRPGTLSYAELASADPNGSRDFYTTLFGWSMRDEDMGVHGIYTQFLKEGEVVGALYKLMKEQEEAGTPPNWGLYMAVENADAAAARAKDLGGQVIMGPMDIMDHGRMCVLADPVGAVFCVWQAKDHIGLGRKNENGALCWAENMTNDLAVSRAFYQGFFHWTTSEMDMGPAGVYVMLGHDQENLCCGMMQITPEMGPVPPHWLVYFAVADISATVAQAAGLGAATIVPPTEIPGGSQFSVLRDPQGAFFGVFQGSEEDCES